MDTGMFVGEAVGLGVKIGFLFLFGAVSFLLPASYMMNMYAHHSMPMRIFMGVIGGFGSWALLLAHAWLVGLKRAPFKTLFPVAQFYPEGQSGILGLFNFVEKADAFQKAFASYTVPPDPAHTKTFKYGDAEFKVQQGVVSPALLEEFRKAGSIRLYQDWKETVTALSPAAGYMLGVQQLTEVPAVPVKESVPTAPPG